MTARFSKKRVRQGRIELFDPAQDKWLPLAMVPLDEREGLDQIETVDAPVELAEEHELAKFDPTLMMGSGTPRFTPPSRAAGWMLGLAVAALIVALLVWLAG